ncbi:hypothetical protein TNIN_15901 [Trichonephila inaurata madagascariensis]|uniref:Uncharacterized protein n=1 Tax=Trichonephila inaurata madagascariensis TaxID=2747483 RepID=A0A8X6XF60_9ARAC|nr:hypothetical protein TNIN_15901 [Trichonephila inaurata madagascariensis]
MSQNVCLRQICFFFEMNNVTSKVQPSSKAASKASVLPCSQVKCFSISCFTLKTARKTLLLPSPGPGNQTLTPKFSVLYLKTKNVPSPGPFGNP